MRFNLIVLNYIIYRITKWNDGVYKLLRHKLIKMDVIIFNSQLTTVEYNLINNSFIICETLIQNYYVIFVDQHNNYVVIQGSLATRRIIMGIQDF